MKSRIACVAVALVALLSGCSGQPDPSDSTPAFATEQEAFAAAEQTYRNYVDALNQVDLSDPATFEEVYRWTTGDANAGARKTFTQMHADGWTVTGQSSASVVAPMPNNLNWSTKVLLAACLDVSLVHVVDSNGESQVSVERGSVQSMLISLASSPSSGTHWLVSDVEGRSGEPSCGG